MANQVDLFSRLGGVRRFAEIISEAPSTVQSWKSAQRIPAHKQPGVIERVAAAGHVISAEDVVFPFGRHASDTAKTVEVSTGNINDLSGGME
jgi:hypothetical protein